MNRRAFGMALASLGAAACASVPGQDVSASVDEGEFVDINGLEQWITMRGESRSNPVMLLLDGGPGAPTSSMQPWFAESTKYVTRVNWDQPGGGATAIRTKDQGEMTAARFVRDGLAVAEHVRAKLGVRKMILCGTSFGTRLGVEMIQRRPDMFSAYVGQSQVVGARGARMRYELALKAVRDRGDAGGVAAMERVGPPPYKTVADYFICQQYANPPGYPPSAIEKAASEAMSRALSAPPESSAKYIAYPGKAGLDPVTFMATQAAMFDESQRWEIRSLGRDFKVPIFVFQGGQDINAPPAMAKEWIEEIHAPRKVFEIVPHAGHNPAPFAFDYLTLLRLHVLPVVQA